MAEKIELNGSAYQFSGGCFSTKTITDNTDTTIEKFINIFPLSISVLDFVEYKENLFANFGTSKIASSTIGGGVESTEFPFRFIPNNNNRITYLLSNEFSTGPYTLNSTFDIGKEQNTLEFNGIIKNSTNLGSDGSIFSLNIYDCESDVQAKLEEIKISSTIFNKIDSSKSIAENIKDILSLVLDSKNIDDESFLRCYTKFPENYIYPNNFSALDALNFLLPFNLTNDTNGIITQLFLVYNRVSRKFILISPADAFLDSNTVPEQFTITSQAGAEKDPTEPIASPSLFKASNGTVVNSSQNSIDSYTFTDVQFNTSNSKFVTTLITSPTNLTGVNGVKIKVQDMIREFESKILTENIQKQYGNKAKLNVDLDNTKLSDTSYRIFRTPYDMKLSEDVVKAQMYSFFMFENMRLTFSVPGQIYRQPGSVIVIDKDRSSPGGEFDKKLIGHWYVMEVKHVFGNKGTYKNEIHCCKPIIQE